MKKLIALLMLLPLPALAEEVIPVTAENCETLFTGQAALDCLELVPQAADFNLVDLTAEANEWFVRILMKEGVDLGGNPIEATAYAATKDEAMLEAAVTIYKVKRGIW